jgi:hypothetical protein
MYTSVYTDQNPFTYRSLSAKRISECNVETRTKYVHIRILNVGMTLPVMKPWTRWDLKHKV